MYKIGIIGGADDVLCFKSCGFEIFTASDTDTAVKGLYVLIESCCAVIFITEDLACQLEKETDKYKNVPIPAIIPIPSSSGKTGFGIKALKSAYLRAIGKDALK